MRHVDRFTDPDKVYCWKNKFKKESKERKISEFYIFKIFSSPGVMLVNPGHICFNQYHIRKLSIVIYSNIIIIKPMIDCNGRIAEQLASSLHISRLRADVWVSVKDPVAIPDDKRFDLKVSVRILSCVACLG